MIACARCANESPDGSTHCVQCGNALPVEPRTPGNTSHFGEDELKGLLNRVQRDEAPAPVDQNLLAGMPRHRVGSMVSPLLGGQTSPTARRPEQRARSASGSTVMGMPLFTAGQAPKPAPAKHRPVSPVGPAAPLVGGAAIGDGPSIQSLGSFQVDDQPDLAPAPPSEPSASAEASSIDPSTPPRQQPVSNSPTHEEPAPASIETEAAEPPPELPPVGSVDETPMQPPPPARGPGHPTTGPMPVVNRQAEPDRTALVIGVIVAAAMIAGLAFYLLK